MGKGKGRGKNGEREGKGKGKPPQSRLLAVVREKTPRPPPQKTTNAFSGQLDTPARSPLPPSRGDRVQDDLRSQARTRSVVSVSGGSIVVVVEVACPQAITTISITGGIWWIEDRGLMG